MVDKSADKVLFDDHPAIIGACLLPPVVAFLKMWRNKLGRAYIVTCAVGLPISLLAILFGSVGVGSSVFVAAWFGLIIFGMPLLTFALLLPLITAILWISPIGLVLGGLVLFGYEAYVFLRTGSWNLITLLDYQPIKNWAMDRHDWVGLKEVAYYVLGYLPVWLLMIVSSPWIASASTETNVDLEKARQDYLSLRHGYVELNRQ